MGAVAVATARPAALALAPLIAAQGKRVRRRIPVLPEADGEREGTAGSGAQPLRLLVVGESTAAGVGVSHQRDGLAAGLAAELARARGCQVAYQVRARTGATARYAAKHLAPAADGDADLVVVVLGVNDTMRLRSRRSWRQRLGEVLTALAPAVSRHGEVVLCGVPDFGAMPALPQPLRAVLSWHGRALDAQTRRVASRGPEAKAPAGQEWPRLRYVPVPAQLPRAVFASDGFHPNAGGYAARARHLAAAISPRAGA